MVPTKTWSAHLFAGQYLRDRGGQRHCAPTRRQRFARTLREFQGLLDGLLLLTCHASRAHDFAINELFPGEEGGRFLGRRWATAPDTLLLVRCHAGRHARRHRGKQARMLVRSTAELKAHLPFRAGDVRNRKDPGAGITSKLFGGTEPSVVPRGLSGAPSTASR
jgi:hypothetical protein